MLENPSARELMQVVVVAGLANLQPTLSDQQAYRRTYEMHLNNILNQFDATDGERILIRKHFKKHAFPTAVVELIENIRK
jgi:hydroxymethylglutaryl-CoA reductase